MGSIVNFLCSVESGFMTGMDLLVDGGAIALSKTKQIDR